MANPPFDFTLIIPVRNSLPVLPRLIEALRMQDLSGKIEWIFTDNASTDGTRAYLEGLPLENVRILDVPEGTFSHSGTRMRAAEEAQAPVLVFLTDDVVPAGPGFLRELTRPVREGKATAAYGVCQVHPEWHDPIDAYLHNGWPEGIADYSEPLTPYVWNLLPPDIRRRLCNFDNCASCFDRQTLLRLRFRPVPYGEDMLFAKDLILSGGTIALARNALFYHWHRVRFAYLFRRMCIDQAVSIPAFGIYYVSSLRYAAKAIALRIVHRTWIALFKLRGVSLPRRLYWAAYNARTLSADFLGKYAGTLEEGAVGGRIHWLRRYLYRKKVAIIDQIERKSILRY